MTDRELVDALCDIGRGLLPWHMDFIESIARKVIDDGKTLTSNQRKLATAILEDKGGTHKR